MRAIAVMTSGGDAPGMNPRVRPIVRLFLGSGLHVKGVRRAYEGPLAERLGPPSSAGWSGGTA